MNRRSFLARLMALVTLPLATSSSKKEFVAYTIPGRLPNRHLMVYATHLVPCRVSKDLGRTQLFEVGRIKPNNEF